MKIYAPVKDATGVWATVRFVNGVGETDNPALIEWFKRQGYRVEKVNDLHEKSFEKYDDSEETSAEKCNEPNFESMTPNELRDWAKANGLGGVIKNTRNKEKLLELIRG